MVEPFEVTFRYDGETLTKGKVRLYISKCKVESIDFKVPTEYAALLLYGETKNEAWRLLEEQPSLEPHVERISRRLGAC